MKTYTFTIVIEKEPEDPGFFAHCPELPGCASNGATIEETRERMQEAIQLYLSTLIEDGLPIPQSDHDVHVERLQVAAPA